MTKSGCFKMMKHTVAQLETGGILNNEHHMSAIVLTAEEMSIFLFNAVDMLLHYAFWQHPKCFEISVCVAQTLKNLTEAWLNDSYDLLDVSFALLRRDQYGPHEQMQKLFLMQHDYFSDRPSQMVLPWSCLDNEKDLFPDHAIPDILLHLIYSTAFYVSDYEGSDLHQTKVKLVDKDYDRRCEHEHLTLALASRLRWIAHGKTSSANVDITRRDEGKRNRPFFYHVALLVLKPSPPLASTLTFMPVLFLFFFPFDGCPFFFICLSFI